MDTPDGKVAHAVIRIGDTPIMMGDERAGDDCLSAETIGKTPAAFYLYLPNVDDAYKQAVSAGAASSQPLTDMFWGDRIGSVKDPFGYTWTLATHVKDPSEKELADAVQKMYAQRASN
jgi:uncharacterized glyoxalase superfamily protein PhnB